jgi:hypothetical protein
VNEDYLLGGREYFNSLPTEVDDQTYRTASFWRYLAELTSKSNNSPHPNYSYLTWIFEGDFNGPTSIAADLEWLDRGLRSATGKGLAHNYSHFTAALANYVPSRLSKPPGGTPEQASNSWLNRLFESCQAHILSETKTEISTDLSMKKNAARCFKVEMQKSQSTSSQATKSGSTILNRIRANKKGATKYDLAIQARSFTRKGIEALWLGMSGDKEVTQAFIGRDAEGYVGYWQFSLAIGESQTFIISNVAEDPLQSLDHEVKLKFFSNDASMSSSSSGLGDVGGPIKLDFDNFLMREILSNKSETHQNAGIENPCMIRLHFRESSSNAEFFLMMDNEGAINPGSYNAVKSSKPEKFPGKFMANINFGKGGERISYFAEAGSLELSAFSPGLLKGKVNILGRLPKKGYGDKETQWPETISVETEFTLVPRINLNSSLLKSDYCFSENADK